MERKDFPQEYKRERRVGQRAGTWTGRVAKLPQFLKMVKEARLLCQMPTSSLPHTQPSRLLLRMTGREGETGWRGEEGRGLEEAKLS